MGDGDVKVSVSKSYISDRPKRLAQAKVQRLSRKTKNRKTKKRYARNLSRGNIRPKMRRQTGLVRVTIRKAEKKKEIGDLPDIGSLRFENSRNRDGRGYTMSELVDLTTRGRDLERGQNILWDKANRKQIAQFDNQGKGRYVYSPSGFALNPTTLASKKNKGKIMANTLDIPRNRMTSPMQGLDWENPLSLFGYHDIPGQWRFGRNNVEGVVRGDLEEEPINFGTASEGEWAGIGRALMEGKNSSTSKNLSDKQKTLMGGLEEVIPPLSLEPYYAEYINEAEDTADRIRRINEAHTATGYDRNFVTDLNPLSQSEVLSEGIPWRGTSEYVAPPVNNKKMGNSIFNGLPMDLSFRLLKRQRQTELGEYGVDAPSSYGPVTEYHGTMDLPNVLNQGIRGGSPKTRSNRYVPKNLRNEESINYTTNDAEKARKFAEERAISLGLNPADVGVVGVRGRDLSDSTEMDEPDGGILENTKSNVRAGNIPREYLVQASEPMDIASQLLKERRSAKALANKKKYDTKYESSPERVKYRVELNRERRRRGIYGSGNGKDVSHTKGGKLTLENQSTNRARHFKNRGTLRDVKVKK